MSPLDWWMYHGTPQHTGAFTDGSVGLDPFTAKYLQQLPPIELPIAESVKSVPAIVSGQAYLGTILPYTGSPPTIRPLTSGTLYRINLQTGGVKRLLPPPNATSELP
jgi:hypothetical protein